MSPRRVIEVLEPGAWCGVVEDHVTLDYDGRHRRRIVLTADHGVTFLLDLPQSRVLPGGAALRLEGGSLIEVIARAEPLLAVRAPDAPSLLRLAWHIGNRHLTAQIEASRLLIRRDPVIAAMLVGLGATVTEVVEGFHPEGGAYGGQTTPHTAPHGDHHAGIDHTHTPPEALS